jgi:chromosome segregation ATPase
MNSAKEAHEREKTEMRSEFQVLIEDWTR